MRKFSLVLLWCSFSLFGQKNATACETLSKINSLLQREHYRPKPVDDSLSVYVFDTFIDGLDPDRFLFTKSDYQELLKSRLSIDDAIKNGDCAFFDEFLSRYKMALERKKSIIEKIEKTPLDYHSKDSVKFSHKSFPFDLAESDLERVWKKRMRYEILEDISGMSDNLDSLKQNFTSIEKDVKERIFETNLCKINSVLNDKNGFENRMRGDLYNALCSYFDPHSNYFTMDEKSSFMSALSTSNLSLGIDFEMNEKEEIVVSEVVPGGPASRSELIQKGDVLVKVSNNQGTAYLVSCTNPDEIGDILYSDANPEIDLTVRKKNGTLQEVTLRKQVMKAIGNSVYSFIAEENGVRTGYIKIPSFYSDFDGNSDSGCADDVVKEIAKLQQDNISGLIIDVQDNGGGSMEEAIKLSGMFVGNGPVAVLSDRKKRQEIIRGSNSNLTYNGPMVLLINGNSASASEFFAAAVQDYKRGILIGATTLGKASMQSILPIDNRNKKDFVKVTLQKFYRITGDSHQRKGVVPDIYLPVLFDSIMQRESNSKTALPYDTIATNTRFDTFTSSEDAKVISESRERLKNNAIFTALNKINRQIDALYNDPKKPLALTLDAFFKDNRKTDGLTREVKDITTSNNCCSVINTSYENEKIASDAYLKEINDYEMADVRHNLFLEEAVHIIGDLNRLKK